MTSHAMLAAGMAMHYLDPVIKNMFGRNHLKLPLPLVMNALLRFWLVVMR